MTAESVQWNEVYLEWTGASGSFGMVARPLEFLSTFKLRAPPLEVRWDRWDSFPNEAGKKTLISISGGKNGALLKLWWDPRCSSRVKRDMSGNFLSCIRGIKDPFEAQEGSWVTLEMPQPKWASSRIEGRISWFFSSWTNKLGGPLKISMGILGPTHGFS